MKQLHASHSTRTRIGTALVSAAALVVLVAAPAAAASSTGSSSESHATVSARYGGANPNGLGDLLASYRSRVPSSYTRQSYLPFARAFASASALLSKRDPSPSAVVQDKNALQDAAAGLRTKSHGTFETVTNDSFWKDTAGNPIYSQGGGVFEFGDTYYWYGVHYKEADAYLASPSKTSSTSTFAAITVYSSQDLVHWTFRNNIATTKTPLNIPESKGKYFAEMKSLADAIWVGRLGVVYNRNTGKFVLAVQSGQGFDPDPNGRGMVLFLQGSTPTGDFEYGNIQQQIVNDPTTSTGDQTVFTDDDGTSYLVFSNGGGRANAYVSKFDPTNSLSVGPAVRIGYVAAGREGNAMFKLGGKYYMAASDLHGWGASATHIIESLTDDVDGAYGSDHVLNGSDRDYSHVSQTGFFITVHGTKATTVIDAGDRWSDFAWNGVGYNQWVPLSGEGDGLTFNSLSSWQLNAVTGQWRVAPKNNYLLNPNFEADRIVVSDPTGWTVGDSQSASAAVTTVSPGNGTSRFAARLGSASPFDTALYQDDTIPRGTYDFEARVQITPGLTSARIVLTTSRGTITSRPLENLTPGWHDVSLSSLALPAGSARISLQVSSTAGGGTASFDDLSLIRR